MSATSATALLNAPWYVHLHIVLAIGSLGLGTMMFLRRKGTPAHRLLGRVWVGAMLATALSSFAIQTSGGLSPIHVLSVITLVTLPLGVRAIRQGRVAAHRFTMGANFAGLAIAGMFTLLPHRILGQLVFGAP